VRSASSTVIGCSTAVSSTHSPSPEHWEAVAVRWRADRPQTTWRRHADRLNRELVARELPGRLGAVLKTDLFDEAVGDGLARTILARSARLSAIDLAPTTVERAVARHPAIAGAVADVRRLPFPDGTFDGVVSNSTLDHFDELGEVAVALAELRRVLRPGGTLVVSLDNLANPIVGVRNVLPSRVRYGTGLVPYYVGATCGPWRMARMLDEAGFDVRARGAKMHCPRVVAVPLCDAADRSGRPRSAERLLRGLHAFEALERLPTRWLTGHFVWARAVAR
jgi:SAM-dependent methyltransferase